MTFDLKAHHDPAGRSSFCSAPNERPVVALVAEKENSCFADVGSDLQLLQDCSALGAPSVMAVWEDGTVAAHVVAEESVIPGNVSVGELLAFLADEKTAEVWVHVTDCMGAGDICLGYCTVLPRTGAETNGDQKETAVCGGSNIKAPMRLDFIRKLREKDASDWPCVYICRDDGGASAMPMCFEEERESADKMNCIGLISDPADSLTALLRAGTVKAAVRSLCTKNGTPCSADSPDVWGFLVEYSVENKAKGILDEAVRAACRQGRGSFDELQSKVDYLTEQAVPENIILRTLESISRYTLYPEMIPRPPVKFAQNDSFGELTRALAYRLCGMNLRLVGNKGCGKNTLMQTVDWVLGVPQYRMQGNAELDKLDLLGGPTIENGTMRYQLSDMLCYLRDGADVVLDEGNTIKPECADVLHSLTDEARQIEVPGYGLVKMHPVSSFTITMNEDYAGTNFMNEATIDRFTPIQMSQPNSIVEILRRVVPTASDQSLRICDVIYCSISDMIKSADGLEPEAMTIRGFVDALRSEPLLGLKLGLLDNVANKPQDSYTRMQLTELIESMIR